jgi:hypothetical protein
MLIQMLALNGGSTTFVWEPQEAFIRAPQIFYQSFPEFQTNKLRNG